jgi:HEAT repeat protein
VHPVLKEIDSLSANPDPQVRVYGLIQIENHLDELSFEEVDRVLARALRESDRVVTEQAKRIQALMKARGLNRMGPEGAWPIWRTVDAETLKRFPRLKVHNLEKLRASAYDLITPLALSLHTAALSAGNLPMERVIDTLARLMLPQSLSVLAHLAKDAFLADRVVVALAGYKTPESEEELFNLAEDTASPVTLKALESMGYSDSPKVLACLEKALQSPDSRRRKAASVGLSHSKDPRAAEWLLATLADGTEDVMLAGITALGRVRATRAADALIKLARGSDSTKLRATVAAALSRIHSPAAFDYLQLLMEDTDPRVKANAVESLAFYQLTPEAATKIFVPSLRSEVPRLRGNAVLGLFRYRPSQAVDSLAQMVNSPDRMMRRAGAWCASQIQTPDTAKWVTNMVLTEQNPEVLKSGMNALQKFSRRESVDVFVRMTTHPRVEVRVLAMQILGSIGGAPQVATLTSCYKRETHPKVRAAVVTSLAQLGGQSALNTLRPYLNDPDERVVANAIQGLHDANNIEAVTYLKPMVMHRNRRIRANTIVNLFALGDLKMIAELTKMIETKDAKEQASGLWALGAIGEDLRLASLEERTMLCSALSDYHRKVLDATTASGARLLANIQQLKPPAPPPLPEPPKQVEPQKEGPVDPGSMVRHIVDLAPEESDEPGASVPDDPTKSEERLLEWEKFLGLITRDAALAVEALAHHTTERPDDEVAQLLYLRALKESGSDALDQFAKSAAARPFTYVALLYELARCLRDIGESDLSFTVYLQIFRAQYQALDKMAQSAMGTGEDANPSLASAVLKQLSAYTGLVADLELEIGSFYLGEMLLEPAFGYLYRARMAAPDETGIALKLAYICRKRSYFKLGRVLCKSILSTLTEEHPDYQRAMRILHDIKNKQERSEEFPLDL